VEQRVQLKTDEGKYMKYDFRVGAYLILLDDLPHPPPPGVDRSDDLLYITPKSETLALQKGYTVIRLLGKEIDRGSIPWKNLLLRSMARTRDNPTVTLLYGGRESDVVVYPPLKGIHI
jgi:hypothetical protein